MRPTGSSLLPWLIVALLLLLVWLTVTGRLGKSRHGYLAATLTPAPRHLALADHDDLRVCLPWEVYSTKKFESGGFPASGRGSDG